VKKFPNPRCPECDELLKLNKKGHLHNKDNTQALSVFFCEECDQSYTVIDGAVAFVPFTANMIPIKETCTTCCKVEHFRQKCVYILNDMMIYEPYCIDCGIEFIRNWARSKKGQPNKIDKSNVQDISETYNMMKTNEVMQDPVKMKKVMESEPYKKLSDELKNITKRKERAEPKFEVSVHSGICVKCKKPSRHLNPDNKCLACNMAGK